MAETRDFNLQVNLTGIALADVMNEDPSPGPHMTEILDVREVTSEKEGGKTTLRFSVVDVEEGSLSRGISTQLVIGCDWEKSDKFNSRLLKNLLCGMGVKPELLTGVIRVALRAWPPSWLMSNSNALAITSRKRPVPAAQRSFISNFRTSPSSERRAALQSCPPTSTTVRQSE